VERARPATPADLPRIVELAGWLRAELIELRGGRLWADREAAPTPLDDAVAAWIADDHHLVVAGCIDDVVVGYGVLEVETLGTGARLGIVHELFVEIEARSVGVGEAIAGALVAHAVEAGCSGVDARALPGHRAAKNFFEEQGFTARAIVMHQDLAPDAGS
jgi:GNAT superfamily N-acetyltransferase